MNGTQKSWDSPDTSEVHNNSIEERMLQHDGLRQKAHTHNEERLMLCRRRENEKAERLLNSLPQQTREQIMESFGDSGDLVEIAKNACHQKYISGESMLAFGLGEINREVTNIISNQQIMIDGLDTVKGYVPMLIEQQGVILNKVDSLEDKVDEQSRKMDEQGQKIDMLLKMQLKAEREAARTRSHREREMYR